MNVIGNKEGVFDAEIAPIPVKTRKGHEDFKVDEGPRPNSTMEGLAKVFFFIFFYFNFVLFKKQWTNI